MKLDADPLTTYAVLVGVETYSGGDDWALDGPATNALRMAAWLLEQQVPADHIALYVNFTTPRSEESSAARDQLQQLLAAQHITAHAPTRALLEAALDPATMARPAAGSGTLLVYFSGHGLSSEVKRKRYALTAEAREGAHHAIDIEYHAANLRLNKLSAHFATQWIIQDACAQTSTGELRPMALRSDLPETPQGVRQYCLYATRPGEFALTEGARAGEFTWQLLDVLQGAGPLRMLDLNGVYDELERRFKLLEQHPTLYRHDDNWAEASLAPGIKSDGAATAELIALLASLAIGTPMLRAVFCDVARSQDEPPCTVKEMLRHLDTLVMDQATGLNAVELFALRLESYCARYATSKVGALAASDRKEYQSAARTLAKWTNTWAAKRARAAVMRERRRLADAAQMAQTSPVIVLELKGGAERSARAWRYGDGAPLDADILEYRSSTLGAQVAELLGMLAERQWLLAETVIELVLPLDVLLQHFPDIEVVLDAKFNVRYRLGARQLLLVVRVAERWSDRAWNARWTDYWQATAAWRCGRPRMAWLNSGTSAGRDAWYWLGASDIENVELSVQLRKALYEGLPFAAWCAEDQIAHAQLALTGHTYADLIQLLQQVGKLNDKSHKLTCLIDDPDRLPPGASLETSRLRQPTLRVQP